MIRVSTVVPVETRRALVAETVRDLRNYEWTDGDNAFNIKVYGKALADDVGIPVKEAIKIVDDAVGIVAFEDVDDVVDETSPCSDDEVVIDVVV